MPDIVDEGGQVERVVTTAEHPFYRPELGRFVRADEQSFRFAAIHDRELDGLKRGVERGLGGLKHRAPTILVGLEQPLRCAPVSPGFTVRAFVGQVV